MRKIEKIIWSQDAFFKTEPRKSGETSINLSNEIFEFLGSVENGHITFKIFKEDYLKALCSLSLLLPLYTSSSKEATLKPYSNKFFDDCYKLILKKFGDSDSVNYKVHSLKREDGRIYLNELKENETGFNIRYFFVQSHSVVTFVQKDDGSYDLRFRNSLSELSKDQISDTEEVEEDLQIPEEYPHQQIFYGAPGTGKSHTIKSVVEEGKFPHIRTTFHPDSDYSTFVGAYKPTTIDVPMRDVSGHIIVEGGNQVIEKKIIYTFVPQAFLKAYVAAWSNLNEPFFLIIEEINRGNCAQIFGDLFQLLDRNSEGISDYPVTSDDDIRRYLNSKFSALDNTQRADIPDEILSGEKMLLPQNLHIWATMNTSDQSLFPIDSAFKRRWDWKYTPIANGNKGWKIAADGKEYDWWQFLEKINAQIGNATHSEDKKLGYYFCKPINNQTIDAETFVSKVVFYLWNDVFKDFAEDAGSIFNDEDGTVLSFNKFYTTDTNGNAVVVEQKVTQFLQNLGVDPLQDVE
ncbi:MAG: AAA family ATPase [Bacteroidales bacterium]|nr:AAA family ATPase [Bacteroidales bacterium]